MPAYDILKNFGQVYNFIYSNIAIDLLLSLQSVLVGCYTNGFTAAAQILGKNMWTK